MTPSMKFHLLFSGSWSKTQNGDQNRFYPSHSLHSAKFVPLKTKFVPLKTNLPFRLCKIGLRNTSFIFGRKWSFVLFCFVCLFLCFVATFFDFGLLFFN